MFELASPSSATVDKKDTCVCSIRFRCSLDDPQMSITNLFYFIAKFVSLLFSRSQLSRRHFMGVVSYFLKMAAICVSVISKDVSSFVLCPSVYYFLNTFRTSLCIWEWFQLILIKILIFITLSTQPLMSLKRGVSHESHHVIQSSIYV